MACQIKRDNNNNIIEVLAPNGKPSMLYDTLKSKLNNFKFKQVVVMDDYVSLVVNSEYIQNKNNEELALAAWSKAYTKEFINSFGDWKTKKLPNTDVNGEPDVDSLFDVRTVNEQNLTAETVRELSYMMQGKTDTNYKLTNDKDRLFISRIEDNQVTVNLANVTPDTNIYDVFGHVVLASVKKNNLTLYNNLIDVTKTNQKVKNKDYRYKLSKGEFYTTSDKNQAARAQKNLDYVLGKTTEKPPYISGIGYLRFKDGELYTYKSALNLEYDRSGIKLDIKETTNKLQSIIDEAEERYLYSDNISDTIQEESMLELLNLYNSNQLEDKTEIRLAKELLKEVKSFIQKILPQKDLNQLPENLTVNDITGLLFQKNQVKPGVSELFESDPELANAVYEALGFKSIPAIINEAFKKEKEVNEAFSDSESTFVYYGDEDMKDLEDNRINPIDTVELSKEYRQKGLGTLKYILEGEKNLKKGMYMTSDPTKRVSQIADKIWNKLISLGLAEKRNERYYYLGSKITPQQEQQAQQLYSQYLDTVFPDSKVKDIVYHTNTRGYIDFNERNGKGLFVTPTWELAKTYKPYNSGKRFQLLINSKNMIDVEEDVIMEGKKVNNADTLKYVDNYGEYTEYVVFEPEQIHILGSNTDIQQFKQYVQTSSGKNWTNVENNCPKL